MSPLTRIAAILAACCGLSTIAQAADVYTGTTSIRTAGTSSAACAPRPIRITITDGHFAFGGAAPLTAGAIAPDGSFSGTYTTDSGAKGRTTTENILSGRLQGGKLVGTITSSGGCVHEFTLEKK